MEHDLIVLLEAMPLGGHVVPIQLLQMPDRLRRFGHRTRFPEIYRQRAAQIIVCKVNELLRLIAQRAVILMIGFGPAAAPARRLVSQRAVVLLIGMIPAAPARCRRCNAASRCLRRRVIQNHRDQQNILSPDADHAAGLHLASQHL